MHNAGKILIGVLIFFVLVTIPVWNSSASGKADYVPQPVTPDESQCIETGEWMTLHHMDLLNNWRQHVVREGETIYHSVTDVTKKDWTMSLTETCLGCHTSKADFCDQCHSYADVEPECWSCHNVPGGE